MANVQVATGSVNGLTYEVYDGNGGTGITHQQIQQILGGIYSRCGIAAKLI